MKLGVNASGLAAPTPEEAPGLVRFQRGLSDLFHTAVYATLLVKAGKTPLPTAPWTHPDEGRPQTRAFKRDDAKWVELLREWSANVPGELHIFGNEPPPSRWGLFRSRLKVASRILRADGHRVALGPAVTSRTGSFLRSTPKALWREVDAVDLHPYGHTPEQVQKNVRGARALVPDRLPLIASELGWATLPSPAAPHPFIVTAVKQATNLARAVKLLRADGLLELACVFTWADHEPRPGDGKPLWWWTGGLHDAAGEPRGALATFQELAG